MSGLITVGVAVFTWRTAATASWALLIGLAAVLADRVGDGLVTEYLHTGWWPTFNLADVFISLGAITVALAVLRADAPHSPIGAGSGDPAVAAAGPETLRG